jgi:holo-[acyl-carrier protein] synthase
MIIGVGTDLVDVARFAASLERTPTLRDRLFTSAEAEQPMQSLAARFAAKEALAKALGAPAGLSWQDAEVVRDERGRPSFTLTGTVAARAAELGATRVHLSLAHDADLATATVVLES